MPKGTIVSEAANGRYYVTLDHDVTRAEAGIITLGNKESATQDVIDDLEIEKTAAEVDLASKQTTLNNSIDILNTLTNPTDFNDFLPIVQSNTASVQLALSALTIIGDQIATAELALASFYKEKIILQKAVDTFKVTPEVLVLGVSLETGRTGEVDILYLHDQPQDSQARIAPTAHSVNSAVRQPMESSGSSAIVYNLSVMPGYQKWAPDYKPGIISNINTSLDTATVTIADNISNIVGYDGTTYNTKTDQTVFEDVPVVYLASNSLAFTDGDIVTVSFSGDLNTPEIIGFAGEPKPDITTGTAPEWWNRNINATVDSGIHIYVVEVLLEDSHDLVQNWMDYTFEMDGFTLTPSGTSGSELAAWLGAISPFDYARNRIQTQTTTGGTERALIMELRRQAGSQPVDDKYGLKIKKLGVTVDEVCIEWTTVHLGGSPDDEVTITNGNGGFFGNTVLEHTGSNANVTISGSGAC